MAYKRHSQGGRFKRGEFGDLGLRAYKDQQDRQIQHLKDQNRQEQLYSAQHLRQIEGSGAKEVAHNRMLQGLQEDVGKLALDNTQLRGKREVDEILGRAKEAGKQAEFWKDFSTTYAGQYAKASGQLYDFATEVQHQNQMDVWRNDPRFQKSLEEFGTLNEINQKNLLIDSYKAFIDKGETPDSISKLVAHYSDLGLRANHKTKMALTNMILKKWTAQADLIKREAIENDVEWNSENITNLFKLRAHELLKEFGISPTSMAGRQLLEGIFDKALDTGNEATLADVAAYHESLGKRYDTVNKGNIAPIRFAKSKGNIISSTGRSVGNFYSGLNQAVIHNATRYRTDQHGNVIKPNIGSKPNLSASFQEIGKRYIWAGYFDSWDQIVHHLLNAPIPDLPKDYIKEIKVGEEVQLTYNKKRTWGTKQPAHVQFLREEWKKMKAEEARKATAKLKNEDALYTAEVFERTQLPKDDPKYINITDREQLSKVKDEYGEYDNTNKMLSDWMIFNQTDKKNNIVNQNMNNLYKSNDIASLTSYIDNLPEGDTKKFWANKRDQLELLHRNGLNQAGLKDRSKGYLAQMIKELNQDKSITNPNYQDMVDGIGQEFLYQLSLVFDDPANANLGDSKKISIVDKAIRDQMEIGAAGDVIGSGIFRRTGTGRDTEFLSFLDKGIGAESVSLKELEGKISTKDMETNEAGYNSLFTELETNKGKITIGKTQKYLLPVHDVDLALRHLRKGEPIDSNKIIKHIVNSQPKEEGKVLLNERDVWNIVLKSYGIAEEIPPGEPEWTDYILEVSTDINVDTSKMSEENKACVGAYCSFINSGIINSETSLQLKDAIPGTWAFNTKFKENFNPYTLPDNVLEAVPKFYNEP